MLLSFDHRIAINRQKSVRARVMLFYYLQVKLQIPLKKSVKNNFMTV